MKKKFIDLNNMTDKQKYLWDYFCAVFGGDIHVDSKPYEWGEGIAIDRIGSLATYDFALLSAAVILAHDFAVRLEINGAFNGCIRLIAFKRKRDGSVFERHPTIEDAIKRIREIQQYKKVPQ